MTCGHGLNCDEFYLSRFSFFTSVVLSAVISFFFSLSETSIIAISKIKLRHMLAQKVRHSENVQYLITHSDKFIVGILDRE